MLTKIPSVRNFSLALAIALCSAVSVNESASALTISGGLTPTNGPRAGYDGIITDFDSTSLSSFPELTAFDRQDPRGTGGADTTLRISNKQGNNPSLAKFTFNDFLPYFGFEVVDINNNNASFKVSLFKDDESVFSGSLKQILKDLDKCDPSNSNSCYVNFFELDPQKRFNMVLFEEESGGNGNLTTLDNIAYKVPTPALLPGLIGMGVAAYRKRKNAGEVQEA